MLHCRTQLCVLHHDKKELVIKMQYWRVFAKKGKATLYLLSKITIAVFARFWRLCTVGLLVVVLLFCVYGGVLALAFIILGVFGVMYHAQDMLLFHPETPADSRIYVTQPSIFQLPYESFMVQARDGTRLHAMFVKQVKPGRPTVLFFHGNAGNIGHRLANILGLYSQCGFNILLLEYRGYGRSDGSPSEHKLYMDAEAGMDFLLRSGGRPDHHIFLFGRSLGGAVAIRLASTPPYSRYVCGVIVENTFTSIPDMGLRIFRSNLLRYVPMWFYKNKFPSLSRISKVDQPTLLLSGLKDDLVPPNMMNSLYVSSGSRHKRLETFADGTHNETWMCPGYYEVIRRFVGQVIAGQKTSPLHCTLPPDSVSLDLSDPHSSRPVIM